MEVAERAASFIRKQLFHAHAHRYSVSVINLVRLASYMVTGSRFEQHRRNAEHLLVCFISLIKSVYLLNWIII